MFINFALLFLTALIAGATAYFIPKVKEPQYKLALVFAGAYLFSITVIHILPELYANAENPTWVGIYVLVGFFIQQVLEFFTSGAEHGHIHKHSHEDRHSMGSAVLVLVALLLHSFLEGALLSHPSQSHQHEISTSLLTGIILHKAPAAFALMSILLCHTKKSTAFIFLIIFALGSPLGMLMSDYLVEHHVLSAHAFTILFAVVSGNFLHISTTIVFESSVEHSFNIRKMGVALLGALIGVGAEFYS